MWLACPKRPTGEHSGLGCFPSTDVMNMVGATCALADVERANLHSHRFSCSCCFKFARYPDAGESLNLADQWGAGETIMSEEVFRDVIGRMFS